MGGDVTKYGAIYKDIYGQNHCKDGGKQAESYFEAFFYSFGKGFVDVYFFYEGVNYSYDKDNGDDDTGHSSSFIF